MTKVYLATHTDELMAFARPIRQRIVDRETRLTAKIVAKNEALETGIDVLATDINRHVRKVASFYIDLEEDGIVNNPTKKGVPFPLNKSLETCRKFFQTDLGWEDFVGTDLDAAV